MPYLKIEMQKRIWDGSDNSWLLSISMMYLQRSWIFSLCVWAILLSRSMEWTQGICWIHIEL